MTIRRLQPGETELFKQIRLRALQDAPYAFSSTYADALQRSDQSWQQQADSTTSGSERATFIAFESEAPIGMAALYSRDNLAHTGELLQMWVSPDYRGTGLAQQLLEAVSGWARGNGFVRILAGVTKTNPRALRFYTRFGFSILGELSTSDPDSLYLELEVL